MTQRTSSIANPHKLLKINNSVNMSSMDKI